MQSFLATVRNMVELPLLKRELIEAAQRKRMYFVRVLMAVSASVVCLICYLEMRSGYGGILRLLGRGRDMALALYITDLFAIYLVLPIMSCGAISSERERQTLSLLLVTKLGPAKIVAEKFLSCIVPMAGLLIASVPLFAISYLFGGIGVRELVVMVLLLFVAATQAASTAIFCSSFLRSGLSAFWWTYILLALMAFGPPAVAGTLDELRILPRITLFPSSVPQEAHLYLPFTAFLVIVEMLWRGGVSVTDSLLTCWPPLLMSTVMLFSSVLAVRRLSPEKGLGLKLPRIRNLWRSIMDPPMPTGNPAASSHMSQNQLPVTIHHPVDVPADRAIAWRELRSALVAGWPLHVGLMGLYGLTMMSFLVLILHHSDIAGFFITAEIIITILGLLMVSTAACRMFAGERERQTLDSLLSAPITNRDLLWQKQAAANRTILWLLGLLTVNLCARAVFMPMYEGSGRNFVLLWSYGGGQSMSYFHPYWLIATMLHAFGMYAHVILFFWLAKWVATFWGVLFKGQIKAMLATILSIAAIAIVPMLMCMIPMLALDADPDDFPVFFFTTPIITFGMNAAGELGELTRAFGTNGPAMALLLVCVNLFIWGGIILILRIVVEMSVPRLLGRRD